MSYFEERYGIDEASCRRLLEVALSKGGDYADLFFEQRVQHSIHLQDNAVNRAHRTEALGLGVRVIKGEASGYAFCEELEAETMRSAAEIAAAIASGGAGAAPERIETIARPDYYPVQRPWEEVEADERLPLLDRLDRLAFAQDSRVEKVRVKLADSAARVMIVDSDGRCSSDYRPMTVASVACVVREGKRREENIFSVSGRSGIELYSDEVLDGLARQAAERALLLLEAVRPSAGEMPVVLSAGSSGILLHEAIGHGMEADFNRKRTSIYCDKLDEPIAPPEVAIVDDGTVPGARGALNVDDEGNASQRTVLVEGGVLRSYLHDRISARHYGVRPTGNGRRQSFRHLPLPRMRCTYMLPGSRDPGEIIGSVERGIYAVSFGNGQVQIGAGNFTFYIKTGYLIEGGKLTAPIKDVNLIGNGPEVLREITMVGDDMELDRGGWTCGKDGQGVAVSLGMPTVKVRAITVGGVG